jgi:hypothetical protein
MTNCPFNLQSGSRLNNELSEFLNTGLFHNLGTYIHILWYHNHNVPVLSSYCLTTYCVGSYKQVRDNYYLNRNKTKIKSDQNSDINDVFNIHVHMSWYVCCCTDADGSLRKQ